MANRKLILHIGAHKTGTTAIQIYLRRNQAALYARGWEFLLPPTPDGTPANWNFMFRTDPGPVTQLREPELGKMLNQIEKGTHDLILSSEELFFLDQPAIRDFASVIAGRFDQINLVAYIRRQDQMAISHWKQGAKTQQSSALFGNSAGPLKELPKAALGYLDYAKRLSLWIEAFKPDQVSCQIYDRKLLVEGDAVTDFLHVASIFPLTDTAPQSTANKGLGDETVFLLHELRERGVSQPGIKRLLQAKILPQGTLDGLPARAEAKAFVERFRDSNARLSEVIGHPIAFSDDFADYPEQENFSRFSEKKHAELMTQIDVLLSTPEQHGRKANASNVGGEGAFKISAPRPAKMPVKKSSSKNPSPAVLAGKKTILLHVGTHKTGSTTIQKTFYHHRKILKEHGISYLSPNNNETALFQHFTRRDKIDAVVRPTATLSPHERVAKRVEQVCEQIEATEKGLIVLSSEHYSILKSKGLQRLKAFFEPYGQVKIVYFYRDLVPWLASISQQFAKGGSRLSPVSCEKGMLRIYEIPNRLREVFGAENVTMHNFNDAVNSGLLDAVFAGFDVPTMDEMGVTEIRKNEGVSANAVRLLYLYNFYYPKGHSGRDKDFVDKICKLPGEKYKIAGITPKEHADYTAKYPEMTSTLGLKLVPPEEVPIAEYPDEATALMYQVLERAAAKQPDSSGSRQRKAAADRG